MIMFGGLKTAMYFLLCAVFANLMIISTSSASTHPQLVITQDDVKKMRKAITSEGRFSEEFKRVKYSIDQLLALPLVVPTPKDGGGGYTHERHKKNYQQMYNAGVIYQLTQEKKYANFVKAMLLRYAQMYPSLPLHPKRKVDKQNPGKLFWQSLNEAVWLVYTIQAYDLIYDSLSQQEITTIEQGVIRPVALFLSEGSPTTFNKVHNHGTWATAAVGMTGYVIGEQDWVERALYDLKKSGKGGFLRQLDELFSPQGYYTEGPYYQRYALMPFVTFAKAINVNEPARKIFEYRDNIILKAIDTTIQLSYNKLFFPLNDAIKSKGIDTIELVNGVALAYSATGDTGLLEIAEQQGKILLTGDGLLVAQALDNGLKTSYQFKSQALGDGKDGTQGALAIIRATNPAQAVVFKATSQGLGHGHFDKLTWQFYDQGEEIISDYGAARFLNIEAKFGGRYLPENSSWAKQTIAHNTLVVDEITHFGGSLKLANDNYPSLEYFDVSNEVSVTSASIDSAYPSVELNRTLALVSIPNSSQRLLIDIFKASSNSKHQYDLPLHYQGQLIDTNFERDMNTLKLVPVGTKNGYQHLWLKGVATPQGNINKVTWLNQNGRFYTHTSVNRTGQKILFTELGANDPNSNLRKESSFITRVQNVKQHSFVSIVEPHGEYNPSEEFTLEAESKVSNIKYLKRPNAHMLEFEYRDKPYLLLIRSTKDTDQVMNVTYANRDYQLTGRSQLIEL